MTPVEAWLIASFAVWRLTHLLHAEDGPWDLVARGRERLGAGALGRMAACFYCLSFWIALPFAFWVGDLAGQWLAGLVAWPALSGAAIAVERLTDRAPPPPAWFEEPLPGREEKSP